MGLSKEERLLGALYTLRQLGHELDADSFNYWDHSYSRVKKYVAEVRGIVEQLIGLLIQRTETNTAYWILGPTRDGFEGMLKGNLSLFPQESNDFLGALVDAQVEEHSLNDVSLHQFAHEAGFTKHSGVNELLRWWELWAYIPALLYRVNRYDDDLFSSEFRHQLNRLIAQMQLLHKEIGVDDLVEEVMLVKYDIFADWYNKEQHKSEDVDWLSKVKEVAAMTLQDVAQWRLDKMDEQHEREVSGNKQKSVLDPVYGDTVTVDRLVKQVQARFKRPYPSKIDVLSALNRMDGDVERAVRSLRSKKAAEKHK